MDETITRLLDLLQAARERLLDLDLCDEIDETLAEFGREMDAPQYNLSYLKSGHNLKGIEPMETQKNSSGSCANVRSKPSKNK